MYLVTRKTMAAAAAERWKFHKTTTYSPKIWFKTEYEDTYRKLIKLGQTPSHNDVDKVIGSDFYTLIQCHECDKFVEAAMVLGGEGTMVCGDCLLKALLIHEGEPERIR